MYTQNTHTKKDDSLYEIIPRLSRQCNSQIDVPARNVLYCTVLWCTVQQSKVGPRKLIIVIL